MKQDKIKSTISLKICRTCGKEKLIDQFWNNSKSRDGYQNSCKECARIQFKKWSDENKEYQAERYKKWKQENLEHRTAYIKEYNHKYVQSLMGKFFDYKKSARRLPYDWELTVEQFESFWQKPCTYCGSEISAIGVDRIDSHAGYRMDNCVPCCKMCNIMKLDHNYKDWINHMKKILKFTNEL